MRPDLDVLVIDHYDSFTYNLVEDIALAEDKRGDPYVNGRPEVVYHDNTSVEDMLDRNPDAIILSPGPGHPAKDQDIGPTNDILRQVSKDVLTLGICLGMEAIVYEYGGAIERAPEPVHGKTSEIIHDEDKVYSGLENPFMAGRYHSLVAGQIPDCLEKTAYTEHQNQELVMGVRHKDYPIEGLQFHPESILTGSLNNGDHRYGMKIISNFLESAQNREVKE